MAQPDLIVDGMVAEGKAGGEGFGACLPVTYPHTPPYVTHIFLSLLSRVGHPPRQPFVPP